MERNYEKELTIALNRLSEVTAENIALCSLLDDASKKIEEYEKSESK